MDFMDVISALEVIKRHCQETTKCEDCRLHSKYDASKCSVCADGFIPANWDFDLESEITAPSIFK
jgi:hypothetical protein